MSKQPTEVLGRLNYIELREHDEETLRAYLRRKPNSHHCNDMLERAGLKEFFLMPNLAYDVSLVAEAVCLIALHPGALKISYQSIHEITGLPIDAPEVPNGPKQQRKVIAKQYCKQSTDFTSSGIRVEGLQDKIIRQIDKMMVMNLFCLQRYTHFLTHLMRAIAGVVEGKKYNWSTVSSHLGSSTAYTSGASQHSEVARMDRRRDELATVKVALIPLTREGTGRRTTMAALKTRCCMGEEILLIL
eukprot:Gb_27572 [translate_table: standard]